MRMRFTVISLPAALSGPVNPGPRLRGLVLRETVKAGLFQGVSRRCTWPVESSADGSVVLKRHPAGMSARLGDQTKFACPGDGLDAVSRAELAQDVADV